MQKRPDSRSSRRSQYDACVKTPFANLGLCFQGKYLVGIDFIEKIESGVAQTAEAGSTREQIDRYCQEQIPRLNFDIKLKTMGTVFQQKVWKALQQIPAGEVVTYGELAKQLKTSARAVGNACRRNPIPVVIPCHRVVSSSGIGGFAGSTKGRLLDIKKWLLNHEGVQFS